MGKHARGHDDRHPICATAMNRAGGPESVPHHAEGVRARHGNGVVRGRAAARIGTTTRSDSTGRTCDEFR